LSGEVADPDLGMRACEQMAKTGTADPVARKDRLEVQERWQIPYLGQP
jgi:hypothetical protein